MNLYCTNCQNPLAISAASEDRFIKCPNCNTLNFVAAEYVDRFDKITTPGKPNSAFPKILQAILLALSIYGVVIVLSIPLAVIGYLTGLELAGNIYIQGLVSIISFALILFIGFKKTHQAFNDVFPLITFNYSIIIPLLLTVAGSTILISDVDNLVRTIFPAPEWLLDIFEDLYREPGKAILIAVIMAPLTEEFFCRGLILHGFLKNYPVNKAIVASALIFMFMHFNPWQFAGAFFYGLLFAWLVIRTGSLWPALIGHGFANFMPFLAINILGLKIKGFSEGSLYEAALQPWWFDLIGFALALAGFMILRNMPVKKVEKTGQNPPPQFH